MPNDAILCFFFPRSLLNLDCSTLPSSSCDFKLLSFSSSFAIDMEFSLNLDLNLNASSSAAQKRNAQPWRPFFSVGSHPVTVADSVASDSGVAAGVAKGLVTPRDQQLLSRRDDSEAVHDSLALTAQSTAFVSDAVQRLLVQGQDNTVLRVKVAELQAALDKAYSTIGILRQENEEHLSIVSRYSGDIAMMLGELEDLRAQLQGKKRKKVQDASCSATPA